MKQALLDQALASLDAIIRDEIDSDDPQKYVRIIAIAVQAHRMRRRTRRRDRVQDAMGNNAMGPGISIGGLVGGIGGHDELYAAMQGDLIDADPNDPNGNDPNVIHPGGLMAMGRLGRHNPDTGDLMDVLREALSVMKPTVNPIESAAKMLRTLSETRAALFEAQADTTTIDAQIQKLTQNLKTLTDDQETADAETSHPALVHSEFLRRHSAGGPGGGPLPRDRAEDDGARAGSTEGARRDGIEATVVADVEGADAALQ